MAARAEVLVHFYLVFLKPKRQRRRFWHLIYPGFTDYMKDFVVEVVLRVKNEDILNQNMYSGSTMSPKLFNLSLSWLDIGPKICMDNLT